MTQEPTSDEYALDRREFLTVGAIALGSGLPAPLAQVSVPDNLHETAESEGFVAAPILLGPLTERPTPTSRFFSNKRGIYVYQTDGSTTGHGEQYWIAINQGRVISGWNELPRPMDNPTTQIDELRVNQFESFFNHTFARPEAPDSKNWDFTSADITKNGSEITLSSTTQLVSEQRGNYPPGSESIPGVAWRVTSAVTGGECYAGYFIDSDDDNIPDDGFGFGMDTSGTFTFIAKDGSLRQVYQDNWNGEDSVDTDPFLQHYPQICRFPHLFYGGGSIAYRVIDHSETPSTQLKTVHIETPETAAESGSPFNTGPPISQPNLPVAFVTNGLSGGSLRANAAHYERGNKEGETRVNGEHFPSVTVTDTGWTNLISWRKRTGWDAVNVKPLIVTAFAVSEDVKLELQLDSALSSASFSRPVHTSSDESAVEVDTSGTIDTDGERRWVGYLGSGQGQQQPGDVEAESLDFNLPTDKIVTLAAQSVSTTDATVSGVISWKEFF